VTARAVQRLRGGGRSWQLAPARHPLGGCRRIARMPPCATCSPVA